MLTARLILERFSKDGKLLERREKPSKSFVLQLMDFLYLKHAQADRDTRDIDNILRALTYNPGFSQSNLLVASPGGHAGYARIHDDTFRTLEGQDVGIQVGRGDTAVTPTDYKMEDRIKHGRCGASGVTAEFNDPSFETGVLAPNWTEAHNGEMQAVVGNGAWALKDGTYYCVLECTGNFNVGDYAQVSQDIDLTNITHLRFQLRGEGNFADNARFDVLVDGYPVYAKALGNNTDYPNELAEVCAYTGTHTVTFRCYCYNAEPSCSNCGAWIDNIETLQVTELEYGGTELVNLIFSDPNGEFTIRRYFTNNSGVSITVEAVGIQAVGQDTGEKGYAFLIARDLTGGIAVADTEILRVTYVPQITV